MYTLNQMTKARNLVGTDINELEYIESLFIESSKTFFQVISLDGSERNLEISEVIK